jgi:CDP-paratose 2-epimerase
MSIAIITGSAGLVGSEASRHFAGVGLDVVGIDNDMRSHFFGPDASTDWQRRQLEHELDGSYLHRSIDIRDREQIEQLFRDYGSDIALIVHTAAQPSHDWAANDPHTDFSVNAIGTLNLLESTRKYAPDAVFIYTSTNKVYGDRPNQLPLVELGSRLEIQTGHPFEAGITEDFSIDQSLHSLFGASKLAADVMVQEYGKYFGLNTACFRGGCLTGPNHSGTKLHGFLSYLMRCTMTGTPYTVFGYGGKQVRDNIHSADLIAAFDAFFRRPRQGEVYNIGGGRKANCSMIEAISLCQEIAGRKLDWTYSEENRSGDHKWWISGLHRFQSHYPNWKIEYSIADILTEIYEAGRERWLREVLER